MLTPSLKMALKIAAEIHAHPPTSNQGVRGEPTLLFSIKSSPVDTVTPEVLQRFRLETPFHKKVAYVYTPERILAGMYLVVNGKTYPIKGIGEYPDGENTLYELILEDVLVV